MPKIETLKDLLLEIVTWIAVMPLVFVVFMGIGMLVEKQTSHNENVRTCQKQASNYYEGKQC